MRMIHRGGSSTQPFCLMFTSFYRDSTLNLMECSTISYIMIKIWPRTDLACVTKDLFTHLVPCTSPNIYTPTYGKMCKATQIASILQLNIFLVGNVGWDHAENWRDFNTTDSTIHQFLIINAHPNGSSVIKHLLSHCPRTSLMLAPGHDWS